MAKKAKIKRKAKRPRLIGPLPTMCGNCTAFVASSDPNSTIGTCHLHPPNYAQSSGAAVNQDVWSWRFPMIDSGDFCNDFNSK